MRALNIIGHKFGRLTVLERIKTEDYFSYKCSCECGNTTLVKRTGTLTSGNTQSCGCLKDEETLKRSTKHGHRTTANTTSEYRAWVHIKQRCYNPEVKQFKNYGGRGIKVCDRWLESFYNFLTDMGAKPSDKHSLDRYPNNDGNYEPGNCRWATDEQQAHNKRNNVRIEFNGESMVLTEWARFFGVTHSSLRLQLNKMSFAEAHSHYSKNFRENKLTNDQVNQIRNKYGEGMRKCNLAREFNVSHTLISLIVKNKIYKQVA